MKSKSKSETRSLRALAQALREVLPPNAPPVRLSSDCDSIALEVVEGPPDDDRITIDVRRDPRSLDTIRIYVVLGAGASALVLSVSALPLRIPVEAALRTLSAVDRWIGTFQQGGLKALRSSLAPLPRPRPRRRLGKLIRRLKGQPRDRLPYVMLIPALSVLHDDGKGPAVQAAYAVGDPSFTASIRAINIDRLAAHALLSGQLGTTVPPHHHGPGSERMSVHAAILAACNPEGKTIVGMSPQTIVVYTLDHPDRSLIATAALSLSPAGDAYCLYSLTPTDSRGEPVCTPDGELAHHHPPTFTGYGWNLRAAAEAALAFVTDPPPLVDFPPCSCDLTSVTPAPPECPDGVCAIPPDALQHVTEDTVNWSAMQTPPKPHDDVSET